MEITNKQAADALRAMAAARMFYAEDHAEDLDECGFLALDFMRLALLRGAEALEAKERASTYDKN